MRAMVQSLRNVLTGNVVPLKRAVEITRTDGYVVRFSEAQEPLTIDEVVYPVGAGLNVASIPVELNGTATRVDLEVIASPDTLITFDDLREGVYDNARIIVRVFGHLELDMESAILFEGNFGTISFTDQYLATIECVGILGQSTSVITEVYSPVCRADLGDKRCKVPIMGFDPVPGRRYEHGEMIRVKTANNGNPTDYPSTLWMAKNFGTVTDVVPSFVGNPGAEVTWGSVTFEAVDSPWTKPAQVASVGTYSLVLKNLLESRKNQSNWFKNGMIIFRTGKLAGKAFEVRGSTGDTIKLFIPLSPKPDVNDWVEIFPGCDHSLGPQGNQKFSNILNFRGEPHAPGPDMLGAKYTILDPEDPDNPDPDPVYTGPQEGPGFNWDVNTIGTNSPAAMISTYLNPTYQTRERFVSSDGRDAMPDNSMPMQWILSDQEIKGRCYFEIICIANPVDSPEGSGVYKAAQMPGIGIARNPYTPSAGIHHHASFRGTMICGVDIGFTGPGNRITVGHSEGVYWEGYPSDGGNVIPWGQTCRVMVAVDAVDKTVFFGVDGVWNPRCGSPDSPNQPYPFPPDDNADTAHWFAAVEVGKGNYDIQLVMFANQLMYPQPANYWTNGARNT